MKINGMATVLLLGSLALGLAACDTESQQTTTTQTTPVERLWQVVGAQEAGSLERQVA
ncbi:hypothetical protein [Deinococcus humi]|uniref:Starvation-inducible outer membrane lipoprotein n=1 Tax=Deinococcus humi TaxID=662880 RepID=A0A7W8NHD4_9DEIO|nr:hypothetical protein [Deinococcus humi]MBB5366436.1 starvation-inducible outer membrane lipoprotein [Deinococcus humi]GGO41920.1 hypothetical protein GCM10008949_53360 [Deinococcus humi]